MNEIHAHKSWNQWAEPALTEGTYYTTCTTQQEGLASISESLCNKVSGCSGRGRMGVVELLIFAYTVSIISMRTKGWLCSFPWVSGTGALNMAMPVKNTYFSGLHSLPHRIHIKMLSVWYTLLILCWGWAETGGSWGLLTKPLKPT